jgi:hypothetical protein
VTRVPTVRKADLDRVLKALRDDGQSVGRVEVEPGGKITIFTGEAAEPLTALQQARAARGDRVARKPPQDDDD